MRRISVFVLFLVITHGGIRAQDRDSALIARLATEILVNGKAYENLRDLTKKIGARLSGSPQMALSEKWGVGVFTSSGADKVWMQECMVPHWVRGGKDMATAYNDKTGKDGKPLAILALGNSIGTGAGGIEAEVLEVTNFDALESKKDQVKGKIVFFSYRFKTSFANPSDAYRDAVVYRASGASRAAKYGAKAVIVRSMTHAPDNLPHTGALRYDTAYPRIPAVAIGLQDADWMSNQLKTAAMRVKLRTGGHFLPDTTGHNVIGELTGSEFPDHFITVGGHLDSWDPAVGAHDDGAGIVQTIEILRALKAIGYKPRNTIRFVLFANEENGLRGGEKYAAEAKRKFEKHLFALESDAGGFTPRGFSLDVSDLQFEKVQPWRKLFQPYGGDTFTRGGSGADVDPLKEAFAIPAAGLYPDPQRYFDVHHAASDVFEAVNKRELEMGAVNMAILIYLVDKYGL
jgi:carboxypeptidase Q